MPAGRNRNYNPRTGTWTKPKAWYDKPKKRKKKKSGCYIATAVYGSYECPEVWTLRRYRDNYLAKSFLGRLFIKMYYFISPSFVRLFGNKKWFKIIFRNKLDEMVKFLNNQGYSSDEYEDIEW